MTLEQENEKLKADVARLSGRLYELVEMSEEPPERNCSCHISPPCNDCVEYSGLRTALKDAREALSATASSDAWLKEQKAKVLEEAANELEENDEHLRIEGTGEHHHSTELRRMAVELRSSEYDTDQATHAL